MDVSNLDDTDLDEGQVQEGDSFYVVGVGASAGGLEALEQMFQAMPVQSGMSFVIVQHLSPDFKSLMGELLARYTEMPIFRVEDGMKVEPNCLYLIPPKQEMIISDGKLLLTEKDPNQSLSLPIDHFFRTLAQDAGRHSIAVILSGTGSDGSRGIRDISEAGGLVICQEAESAKFDGMPKSAIDTGLVDAVVKPSEIPDLLVRYADHPVRATLSTKSVNESSLEHIYRLLEERHHLAFGYYKPTTIGRRIQRRMQLSHEDHDIREYVKRLERDPTEIDQLYKDLLIGVTRFFRDKEAFESLRHDILPQLLMSCKEKDEFRIWVAGCGTGEEAYSIAMLTDECMKEMNRLINVKIFATDVHQTSLDFAHAGVYPEASLHDLSADRREHYFTYAEDGFRINPEIRKMIVFAPHNLIKDAPFTRLNLITCRNLLIYFRSVAQKKVLSLFHFGLKTGGVLFLGPSESPGDLGEEFDTLNERWKVYRKRRDVRLPADLRGSLGVEAAAFRAPERAQTTAHDFGTETQIISTYDELLERYMPPGILVNEQRQVLQMFGGAGNYLSIGDGRLSMNLLEMVDGDLKLALAGGMQRVIKSGKPVSYQRVRTKSSSKEKLIRLGIWPLRLSGAERKYLVTFEELDQAFEEVTSDGLESLDLDEVSKNQFREMEQELRYTKENLQATIEELETSNEELQATNEELVASNEELQSTNEELHSVNEELYTVNAEYQKKITELTELTNDMDNLLVSTEVHTLFLDGRLCIRKFTPKIADVFNLVPHDVGRRIDAFSHNINCEDLIAKVSQILESGESYEEKVQDKNGHHFLMRLLPYRVEKGLSGVVLTLIDISSLVAAQEDVIDERERFERAIAANRDGTWDWPDINRDAMWWSESCYRLLGYEPGEIGALHSIWLNLIHPEDRVRVMQTSVPAQDTCFVAEHRDFEYRMRHKSGEYRWYRHRAIVDLDETGRPYRMTGSIGDIQVQKIAEMKTAEEIRRRDNFLAMLSHELRNPMGAVLNALECMQVGGHTDQDGLTNEKASSAIDLVDPDEFTKNVESATGVIGRQTKHMARLLDDLLDVARFGQSKIEFRKEVVDLDALAEDVLEAVEHSIQSKSQILHASLNMGPVYVYADPARIKQAQVNLLMNASKFTAVGGEIWYELEMELGVAVITIRDTGEGIPPNLLNGIFDLFVQSESTLARSSGGMGVGLSLSRSIIEAHDGTIIADSEGLGKGSTFRIQLPLTKRKHVSAPPPPHFSQENYRLMVVEDNNDARLMLVKTLRLQGFEVEGAADGQSALDLIESFRPEVAVVDIGLPGMDGYQLANEIRNNGDLKSIMLIALTGYGRTEDYEASRRAGFDAHLVKPLNPSDLLSLITQHRSTDQANANSGRSR